LTGRIKMGEQLVSSVVTVSVAIVGLAIIATLVSKNANTAQIIGAGGSSFTQALTAAVSPVTGSAGLNVAGTYGSAGYMF
jgi:PRD1 phage membrane DNA delivery